MNSYKKIGTKIYYCNLTGNIIDKIYDQEGFVVNYTFEQDLKRLKKLNGINPSTIGLLQLEYGEYSKLSKGSTGVMVDLETKELIFSYEELPTPPQEPTWEEQMEKKISILTEENEILKQELALTQDAVNEMLFMMMNMEVK